MFFWSLFLKTHKKPVIYRQKRQGGIRSFALRSFAQNHSYYRATVRDLLLSLFKKEWFAQVSYDKGATMSESLFSWANRYFAQKMRAICSKNQWANFQPWGWGWREQDWRTQNSRFIEIKQFEEEKLKNIQQGSFVRISYPPTQPPHSPLHPPQQLAKPPQCALAKLYF